MDEATSFALRRLEQDLGLEIHSDILMFAAQSLASGCESDELEDLDEMLCAHSESPDGADTYLPCLIQIQEDLKVILEMKGREAREEKNIASTQVQKAVSLTRDRGPFTSSAADPGVPEILLNLLQPELDETFIRYLFECEWRGDVQRIVEDLLEEREEKVNALVKQQESWKKERQQEEEEARKLRQQVIERFALQEIKEPSNRPPPPQKSETVPAASLRYVDGQVVRTKDKYIVDPNSIKPEWDGGSRGRVKGKGKRGAGGVKLGAK